MKIQGNHGLAKETAEARLKTLADELTREYGNETSNLTAQWQDGAVQFAFSTRGFSIQGKAEVTDASWTVEVKRLPLLLKPFEGRMRGHIRDVAERIFAGDSG